MVMLDKWDGGQWRELGRGISVNIPGLPAGTYRVRVHNQNGYSINYKVNLMYGMS